MAAVCLGRPTAQAGAPLSCCSSPCRGGWCSLLLTACSTNRLPAAPQALLAAGRTEELMDRVFSKYQVCPVLFVPLLCSLHTLMGAVSWVGGRDRVFSKYLVGWHSFVCVYVVCCFGVNVEGKHQLGGAASSCCFIPLLHSAASC